MTIEYLHGDATAPQTPGNKIIAHICNDIGGWGRGFVLAISGKWKAPEAEYRKWHRSHTDFELGAIQLVQVSADTWVANMIAQRDIKTVNGIAPIRYPAVLSCLEKLRDKARAMNASVHMPRIGCGLAGGQWEQIEPLITQTLTDAGIATFVYDRN